jgi:hypothetical protein
MKKLLAVLLIISFSFAVSANTVKEKQQEKVKIEKTVLQPDFIIDTSLICEQLKEFVSDNSQKTSPIKQIPNYNLATSIGSDYLAEISRKIKLHQSITT